MKKSTVGSFLWINFLENSPNSNKNRQAVFTLQFLFILFLSCSAWPYSICYSDKYYPAVVKLEPTENGFIAYLGGKFRVVNKVGRTESSTYPAVSYEGGKWKLSDKVFVCANSLDCIDKDSIKNEDLALIPQIPLSKDDAIKYLPNLAKWDFDWCVEQCVSSIYRNGDTIWFGIGFYDGEGLTGVGGFGRYDIKTKRMEIKRPELILDSSISPIVFDGESLWFGTYYSYECLGTPPSKGIVRYNWKTGEIESFKGKADGPCGFLIRDFLRQGKYLWVATDLGLSRWDFENRKWDHFLPTLDENQPMKSTSCEALYSDLLKSLPQKDDPDACNNFGTYYTQLTHELEKFRPEFLRTFLLSKASKEWTRSDITFLAESSKDFDQLNEEVISKVGIGTYDYEIIAGFDKKKNKSIAPGWREYLLKVVFSDKGALGANLAFGRLFEYKNDEKVGEAALSFLKKQEPGKSGCLNFDLALGLVRNNLRRRCVPIFIEMLDKFQNDPLLFCHISMELDRETKNKFTGLEKFNGLSSDLPSSFSPEKILTKWMDWWAVHKNEYPETN
ncbi:MAG TPA: hypothetical protein PK747_06455 [Acidobacteriota bacterium]|jgi:hypothetical protein|nr:hypothetical protein [Acidobacteriota bacterium]HQO21256.1 hypothetical protein [Acidobacteriota bacterium]HQQ47034.1 hypothetical protein [Acidobacteriota bacterium]